MRIISRRVFREFWERHPESKDPLQNWLVSARQADWGTPAQVIAEYPHARTVGSNRVVFKIKGNKFRLVVAIKYKLRLIYVGFIGTHPEYESVNVEEV